MLLQKHIGTSDYHVFILIVFIIFSLCFNNSIRQYIHFFYLLIFNILAITNAIFSFTKFCSFFCKPIKNTERTVIIDKTEQTSSEVIKYAGFTNSCNTKPTRVVPTVTIIIGNITYLKYVFKDSVRVKNVPASCWKKLM